MRVSLLISTRNSRRSLSHRRRCQWLMRRRRSTALSSERGCFLHFRRYLQLACLSLHSSHPNIGNGT